MIICHIFGVSRGAIASHGVREGKVVISSSRVSMGTVSRVILLIVKCNCALLSFPTWFSSHDPLDREMRWEQRRKGKRREKHVNTMSMCSWDGLIHNWSPLLEWKERERERERKTRAGISLWLLFLLSECQEKWVVSAVTQWSAIFGPAYTQQQ